MSEFGDKWISFWIIINVYCGLIFFQKKVSTVWYFQWSILKNVWLKIPKKVMIKNSFKFSDFKCKKSLIELML